MSQNGLSTETVHRTYSIEQPLKIGTRGSPLALAQANMVRARWEAANPDLPAGEIVTVKTTGDQVQDRPLSEIGGKGLFTRELDAALFDGRIDIAVHSMKDVPTFMPEAIAIVAMLEREDPRDCWLSKDGSSIQDLAQGAIIGTCSLRRKAQLMRHRPDLNIVDLRGNIQTRMKKLAAGEFDATMLAMAGLNRMDVVVNGMRPIDATYMVPAAGQAAIGIAARCADTALLERLSTLGHDDTTVCVNCERALLAALDGSCRTPIGAYATIVDNEVRLHALLASPDGKIVHELSQIAAVGSHVAMGKETGLAIKRTAGPDFLAHW